jgi:hypothetical protein
MPLSRFGEGIFAGTQTAPSRGEAGLEFGWRSAQRRPARLGIKVGPVVMRVGEPGSPPISKPGAGWTTPRLWRRRKARARQSYDRAGNEIALDEVERIAN